MGIFNNRFVHFDHTTFFLWAIGHGELTILEGTE